MALEPRQILRIRANRTSRSPKPVSLQINITGRCPCRCWHCEKALDRSGADLAWDVLMRWLDQAAAWNCPVLYSGGEPMVHARWAEILEEGLARGLRQSVVTSGVTFAGQRHGDGLALTKILDEVLVSLDSPDPETHDRLRGMPGLAAGVAGFLERCAGSPGIWLVHVPPPDFGSVEGMIRLASRYGVGLIVQPFMFRTVFPGLAPLEGKEDVRHELSRLAGSVAGRVRDLAGLARSARVPTNLEEIERFVGPYYRNAEGGPWYGESVLPRFVCSIPWQHAVVDERGRVQPCVFLPGEEHGPGEDLDARWRRQALAFRPTQLAGRVWPECLACSCHFGSNYRNSLLMFPWRNRSGWGALVRKRAMRLRHSRRGR